LNHTPLQLLHKFQEPRHRKPKRNNNWTPKTYTQLPTNHMLTRGTRNLRLIPHTKTQKGLEIPALALVALVLVAQASVALAATA
jgi:hypothetical protein